MKNLTKEQKQTLINRGLDVELLNVLTNEELTQLLKESEKESLVIRTQKTRTNICTELVNTFNNEQSIVFTKDELAERIRLLNQGAFFSIKKDGQDFKLSNSKHAKVFMLLKNYAFSCEVENKKTKSAPLEKDKVLIAVGLWLSRGKAIVNEITKETHAKYFNGYELDYTMAIDGNNITFTRK